MKKYILIIILLLSCIGILVGCDLNNNPTSKVEDFLSNYQMLEDNIRIDYTDLSNDYNISDEIKGKYNDLIKKQYRNISYEIKDEKINGNKATITTEIKVMNYKKVIKKYDKTMYSEEEYHKLITENLKTTKETIIYTIDFTVLKNDNGNWIFQTNQEDIIPKLLGMK